MVPSLTPAAFIAVFCIVFDHNVFAYLRIDLQDLGYIPVTILAEMSGNYGVRFADSVSDRVDWTADIGNISWISSITEEEQGGRAAGSSARSSGGRVLFRGTLFLILYLHFEQLGFGARR